MIDNLIHGGMVIFAVAFLISFLFLWHTEAWTDVAWAWSYLFFAIAAILSLFIAADLFRWAVLLVVA